MNINLGEALSLKIDDNVMNKYQKYANNHTDGQSQSGKDNKPAEATKVYNLKDLENIENYRMLVDYERYKNIIDFLMPREKESK